MHLPRRNDLIAAEGFSTCRAGTKYHYMQYRWQVQVCLKTVAGAPTPGQWTLVINHTRIGTGQPKLRGKAAHVVTKKQRILACAIERSIRGTAGATGIVVGDLNFNLAQVDTVLESAAGQQGVGNLRCWSDQGHAWQ